jgi:hypothetical protein
MVVEALADGPASAELVDGLVGRCSALRNMVRLAEAMEDARTALALARQIGYTGGEAASLTELSLVSLYADDGDQAVELAKQAQQLDRDRMSAWDDRQVDRVLLYVLMTVGHGDDTHDLCERAMAQARALVTKVPWQTYCTC